MLKKFFKNIDKFTHYKVGKVIRAFTNVNSRDFWDKKLAARGNFWRDFPYRHIAEFLPQEEGFSLLDIGCALGDGDIYLKKTFPQAKINGLDFSEYAIKKAKSKSDAVSFFRLDILKDDLPASFDYIMMASTIEHFNDPFFVVDKCLKAVRKALIIFTPYTQHFDNPVLYSRGQHRYLFNEHTFDKYKPQVLKITEPIKETGYRYILYKILA
jgi:SAM-dependent methyltransferase